jgi:FtsZ-interacting cell division protein ZipA
MTISDADMLWLIGALVLAAVLIVAFVASRKRDRARSVELRERFGPEYDRAVQEHGSAAKAERELAARARRVERISFRELSDGDRARFTSSWSRIQEQFVDDPHVAVAGANQLIKEVMQARGYPSDGFEQRAADLSVDHPDVVQHYRAARALAESDRDRQATTEELRQAVVHYRVLFADLLQPPAGVARPLREAHA